MRPTDVLMNEHRVIEKVLDCLEVILDRCEADNNLDLQSATQATDFLDGFVEHCHHRKEERCLFPVMEGHGFSGDCSPVTVMFREHELGHVYLQGMRSAIKSGAIGGSESLKWFIQHGRGYLNLIREHLVCDMSRSLRQKRTWYSEQKGIREAALRFFCASIRVNANGSLGRGDGRSQKFICVAKKGTAAREMQTRREHFCP